MKKVIKAKDYITSVRLQKDLYEQVELKSKEMGGIGVSETIRILLNESLNNPDLDFLNPEKMAIEINNKIQYKILQNVVTCYYLLKVQIESCEKSLERDRTAHARSRQAIEKILGQSSSE